MTHASPLRYPGGKGKLTCLVRELFEVNGLLGGHYVEPYAGGAEIALQLLFLEYATHVHLNDLNLPLISFWKTLLAEPEWLCRMITDTSVTPETWKEQREIYRQKTQVSVRRLGFAFFFLNRTNRSGILNGGMIGGYDQTGSSKIDARYNKADLVRRIQKIAGYKNRISIYSTDAADFVRNQLSKLPERTLTYFDPPYFVKGGRLYDNHYKPKDHAAIAALIQSAVTQSWIVSYDNVSDILPLYATGRRAFYALDYSAARRFTGSEVMFFSRDLILPGRLPFEMQVEQPLAA